MYSMCLASHVTVYKKLNKAPMQSNTIIMWVDGMWHSVGDVKSAKKKREKSNNNKDQNKKNNKKQNKNRKKNKKN